MSNIEDSLEQVLLQFLKFLEEHFINSDSYNDDSKVQIKKYISMLSFFNIYIAVGFIKAQLEKMNSSDQFINEYFCDVMHINIEEIDEVTKKKLLLFVDLFVDMFQIEFNK